MVSADIDAHHSQPSIDLTFLVEVASADGGILHLTSTDWLMRVFHLRYIRYHYFKCLCSSSNEVALLLLLLLATTKREFPI